MSSIIENKQLVHIGTEIVILAGLSYYFNNKNVKLLESIEVINLRLNQQEEMIQKQEMMIKKLMIKVEQNHSQRQPSIEPKKISKKQNIVSFEETDKINIVRIEEDEEETESALDDEIEEELNELKTK
jgi:hypothetical protein